MIVGYDPARVAELGRQTRWAIGGLDGIQCSDPAAASAVSAARRLRGVLVDGVLRTVAAIEAADPLARSSSTYDEWLRQQLSRRTPTPYAGLSDEDVLFRFQVELTRMVEDGADVDLDDWTREFELRAAIDPQFRQSMIMAADRNPLIGSVVAGGRFDRAIVVGVTATLLASPWDGPFVAEHRNAALDALLSRIAPSSALSLDLLVIPGVVDHLLSRPEADTAVTAGNIATIFSGALQHPFVDASRLVDAQRVISTLAASAPLPRYDRGFPPTLAPAITTGLLAHLPFFVGSLNDAVYVSFFADDGIRTTHVGTKEHTFELFGALLREPQSRAMLLAAIPNLAAASGSKLYDLGDVEHYVAMLTAAADGELLDEELAAQRRRGDLNLLIDVVATVVESALKLAGAPFVAIAGAKVADAGARWLVNQVEADHIGLDDLAPIATLLFVYGTAVAALDPDDADAIAQADRVEQLLDDDAPIEILHLEIYKLGDMTDTTRGVT